MPCFHPMPGFRAKDGSVVFVERQRFGIEGYLSLPCGQCIGCRLERSRQWAMRCLHEASLYDHSWFVTLTYDDASYPEKGLQYSDFQKFMKRLRKHHEGVRFYMCGEYGDTSQRGHYHAILFNLNLDDLRPQSLLFNNQKLFVSSYLEKTWGLGDVIIGAVTFDSAAYVARYCMKKVNGDLADSHYFRVNNVTGEICLHEPEFAHMSLKPGIGRPWLDKYVSDVFPRDYVIVKGQKCKPPKYYDRVFDKSNPDDFEWIQIQRELDSINRQSDNTYARLAVKETVTHARISQSNRNKVN